MLADQVEFVIGVDTHKQSHSAALVASNGGSLSQLQIQSSEAGYRHLVSWADEHAKQSRAWAIEGTGSYGAGLTAYLQRRGELVVEVDRPTSGSRGKSGAKSDAIDAIRAARQARDREHLASPRHGATREALRVLQTTRNGLVKQSTKNINQLHAQLLSAPAELRAKLSPLSTAQLVSRCAGLRLDHRRGAVWNISVDVLRATAQRIRSAQADAKRYLKQIDQITRQLAPELCAERGVGPFCAAQILISWSHRGRFRSEAAFASLAGVAPIEASSGKNLRHRLNNGGDRQLNRALHIIAINRIRDDPATQEYVARRTAKGKKPADALRCLKRYLARHFYRLLERTVGNLDLPQIAA